MGLGKIFFDNGTWRFGQARQTLKRTTSGYGPLYPENFHPDIKCWLNLSTKISESFGTMESTYNVRKLCKIQLWLAILNFVLFFLFKLTLIKPKLQLWWLEKYVVFFLQIQITPGWGGRIKTRSHHSTHGLHCKFIGERQNKSQSFWKALLLRMCDNVRFAYTVFPQFDSRGQLFFLH